MNEMNSESFLHLLNNDPSELIAKANIKREKKYKNQITFSRNIFVPVTHQCRNRCGYCSFVSDDSNTWVFPDAFNHLLLEAKNHNCKEVLLTLGEKPEEKFSSARDFLEKLKFKTTVDYVNFLCELALDHNLLPHSNLGVVSYEELQMLKQTNASLGLMLETNSERLMNKGEPHQFSPGKNPSLRIETIENAGKLNIPFTTGILIGIGETWEERIESLQEIADMYKKYNHIQEVIVQNFNPQENTPMANFPPPKEEDVLLSIALARIILPDEVSIQVPPNLNRDRVKAAINHGANDLGGISPVSIDYINPNLKWQEEINLSDNLHQDGFSLVERLPVYPQYEKYLNHRIRGIVEELKANEEISTPKN
jgi:7,8-didemethyl-8-hydroxy-5-deazariboflavin synthase CofG subunit